MMGRHLLKVKVHCIYWFLKAESSLVDGNSTYVALQKLGSRSLKLLTCCPIAGTGDPESQTSVAKPAAKKKGADKAASDSSKKRKNARESSEDGGNSDDSLNGHGRKGKQGVKNSGQSAEKPFVGEKDCRGRPLANKDSRPPAAHGKNRTGRRGRPRK